MFSFTLFTISGVVLVVLMLGKRMAEKRRKPFFIFKAITHGDEKVKLLRHKALHLYAHSKDRASFFLKKQLPMQAKISFNKLVVKIQDHAEKYVGNIRDSRLIKKQDGISEFFKNMSEVEKGNGEINEIYEEAWSGNKPIEEIGPLADVVAVSEEQVKPVRKRATRKKLVVTEVVGEEEISKLVKSPE